MENYILPFLSIIIGLSIVLFLKPKNKKNIKLLLAFSGAFLLAMTVFTLIPEVFHSMEHNHNHLNGKEIGIWIVVGILLQIILERQWQNRNSFKGKQDFNRLKLHTHG